MIERNEWDGRNLWETGVPEIRDWFTRQWKVWPDRVDPLRTTNASMMHGAITSYRAEYGSDPDMSPALAEYVRVADRLCNTD